MSDRAPVPRPPASASLSIAHSLGIERKWQKRREAILVWRDGSLPRFLCRETVGRGGSAPALAAAARVSPGQGGGSLI